MLNLYKKEGMIDKYIQLLVIYCNRRELSFGQFQCLLYLVWSFSTTAELSYEFE